ncbi:protease Lon-related BREX system protein BrxL [Acinetobacter baumannii]|jgi:ATP-dependent Lon protease|uniref:Protease Lon-related BREX system protein BrxL n=4 Tax=Acinetobacter TaxID=469 RepID=A0AA42GC18_ACIJO|nr:MULTISPECIES: protease Lon-related BREX system protein BrxL [Acinetobacter]MBO7705450.1 protease Lon-related BREX system protein BrxL [Acinetobacter sp.]MDD4854076.1 protease Lon-related BREX system protein BrxL [Acinetobacter towneri]EKU5045791.1 protease Lon-related BREX system protein BrxL [Acinetobacter baumannii]EXE12985.1 lon protease (S16) C-terminal proteolytic domain protein [Acinetobacter sp. 983759]MBZ0373316.1 protease Lon-related BREX system protein BrxL [Acinetobacter baumanni
MESANDKELDQLLNEHFAGRVVRKDLTKLIKEGANVPVYVLEYLLGMYCASDDPEIIEQGLRNVKTVLAENYVRPDEAEKVKSLVRERGSYKVIDRVTVKLNERKDKYEASFSNLGIKDAEISAGIVKEYEKLLVGGIWVIATLSYYFEEGQTNSPFGVSLLKPIQMPNMNMDELFSGRAALSTDQWRESLIRSIGMEPASLKEDVQWHLLARMVPFVENNYNVCELGPRGTGKSHIYKECSPNSILVSGGQTTVANLFYNMSSRRIGLVGLWDVVAFDEVAGISFKDKDGVQIMKDYMASGSFARGREQMEASASMVFVGNINQSVESLVKTSHLLAPFPEAMIDSAFFDRFHAYIPGWEIPKMRPEFFTNRYGLIVDYLAEFFREMRKRSFADAIEKYFKLGNNLNQRDVIAVRKTVSGLMKLLYPHGQFNKEDVRQCLEYALQVRRRVKEQLKKIGGMEFYDVHFSYIDNDTLEEHFVSVKEQGGGGLIPEGPAKPGFLYTIGLSNKGMPGLYRLELQVTKGSGKLATSGLWNSSSAKEQVKIAFDYFKANASRISGGSKVLEHDFHLHVVELQNTGPLSHLALPSLVAFASGLLGRSVQSQMVVLGDMSLGGSVTPVESIAECLQVAFDAGAKKVALPMSSAADIPTIPVELFTKFQTSFYADPVDAVFKGLGVD